MQKIRIFFTNLILLLVLFISTGCSSNGDVIEQHFELTQSNKILIKDFYREVFDEKEIDKADKYIATNYIQHNPWAGDGLEAFKQFFAFYFKENPNFSMSIKRIIAEGDLVAVHVLGQQDNNDVGSAVIDIYRVQDGKIVEHWDVLQKVTESVKNANGML